MRFVALLSTMLLSLTLAAQEPAKNCASALPQNLKPDVSAGNQEWVDGLKDGDADRAVASYSQNAVFCSATGDCVKGPAAIAALYKEVIAKFGRATGASVRSDGLHVDHDLAYESGYAEARFPNRVVRRGRYSTVWSSKPTGTGRFFATCRWHPQIDDAVVAKPPTDKSEPRLIWRGSRKL